MTPEHIEEEHTRRTTLRLPSWLYDEINARAQRSRRSLNQEIADCIMDRITPGRAVLADVDRDQLLGLHTGMLLYASTHPPKVEGVREDDVVMVLLTVAENMRKRTRKDDIEPAEDRSDVP